MTEHFIADCESLSIGDEAWCYYRQQTSVVRRFRDGWPIVIAQRTRSGPGPLLNGNLLLAVVLWTSKRVQAAYGVNKATVRLWRRSIESIRGEAERKSCGSRLAARSVAMAADYQDGATIQDIANKFHVSSRAVYSAIARDANFGGSGLRNDIS